MEMHSRKVNFMLLIGAVCTTMAYIGHNGGWDPLVGKYWLFSGYAWSHLLMYTMIGYINLFGEQHPYEIALALSFGWEYLELLLGVSTGTVKYWTSGGIYGQIQDIVLNMTGFQLGTELRRVMPCKIPNCSKKSLSMYEVLSVIVVVVSIIKYNLRD